MDVENIDRIAKNLLSPKFTDAFKEIELSIFEKFFIIKVCTLDPDGEIESIISQKKLVIKIRLFRITIYLGTKVTENLIQIERTLVLIKKLCSEQMLIHKKFLKVI